MDSSETCIATTGSENVWLRAGRKLFEAAEDIVANTSIVLSVRHSPMTLMGSLP